MAVRAPRSRPSSGSNPVLECRKRPLLVSHGPISIVASGTHPCSLTPRGLSWIVPGLVRTEWNASALMCAERAALGDVARLGSSLVRVSWPRPAGVACTCRLPVQCRGAPSSRECCGMRFAPPSGARDVVGPLECAVPTRVPYRIPWGGPGGSRWRRTGVAHGGKSVRCAVCGGDSVLCAYPRPVVGLPTDVRGHGVMLLRSTLAAAAGESPPAAPAA